ncbi:MAG: hypothetical protein ABFR82_12615, partial [Nitrospirota bacterium]
VIYGSGASFASGYKMKVLEQTSGRFFNKSINPAIDKDFFDKINDEFLEKEYRALWKFKDKYFYGNSKPSMEEVWTAVDLNHKHIRLATYNWREEQEEYLDGNREYEDMDLSNISILAEYNQYAFLGDCGRDFRRLIYNVYSDYEEPSNKDYFKLLHGKVNNSEHTFIGYITFNYDCYLENSIKDIEFKYINASSYTQDIKRLVYGKIPIVKLHGSLNWEEKRVDSYYRIIQHELPFKKDNQIKPIYNNDKDWVQPAIIPPTIFKQEINDDSRTEHLLTQMILQQWRTAIVMLRDADIIIFVGYSFPRTDFHSKRIFQIASMIRRDKGIEAHEILDCTGPNDDKKERIELLKGIFGDESNINVVTEFDKLINSDELSNLLEKNK